MTKKELHKKYGIPREALTEEILKGLGFTEAKDSVGFKVWRIKPYMYYPHIIQVSIGNYDDTNPNCGMVSIYNPKVIADVYGNGRKKKVTFPESTVNIAYYVNTWARLHKIISSLVQENI